MAVKYQVESSCVFVPANQGEASDKVNQRCLVYIVNNRGPDSLNYSNKQSNSKKIVDFTHELNMVIISCIQ